MAAGPHRGGDLLRIPKLARTVLPSRTRVSGVLQAPLRRLDPSSWWGAGRWDAPLPEHVVFLGVYRTQFVPHVRRVVAQAEAIGADVRLWALGATEPTLAASTLGEGRAPRTELLNRLWAARPCDPDATVVLWDDDIRFKRSDLAGLLRGMRSAQLDLAQPTHAPGAHRAFRVTASRYLSLARLVGWIEGGPVVVVGPRARDEVLPFPPDFGMGWGIEVVWHDLARAKGWRLGMLDAVSIHHLAVVGSDYDEAAERRRAMQVFASRGTRMSELPQHLGTWRPWQRHPPWVSP